MTFNFKSGQYQISPFNTHHFFLYTLEDILFFSEYHYACFPLPQNEWWLTYKPPLSGKGAYTQTLFAVNWTLTLLVSYSVRSLSLFLSQ